MDPIHAGSTASEGDVKPSLPWGRAVFSGAVFGALGAAAMSWLGHHSIPAVERAQARLGRNWMTALGGIMSGTVAVYSTLHEEDKAPKVAHEEAHQNRPDPKVAKESVQMESTVLSPGQRSL